MVDDKNKKMESLVYKKLLETQSEVNKAEDGTIEISFAPRTDSGFVFEETEYVEFEGVSSISTAFSFEEVSEESELTQTIREEEAPLASDDNSLDDADSSDEEFVIPDVFDVADAAMANSSQEYVDTIWKGTVLGFTEATDEKRIFEELYGEKTVSGNADPSADSIFEKPVTEPKLEKPSSNVGGIDPTAEIVSDIPDAVVIKVCGTKKSLANESVSVYKFPKDNAGKDAEVPAESDEDAEKREISNLTGHKWEEKTVENIDTDQKTQDEVAAVSEIATNEDAVLEEVAAEEYTESDDAPLGDVEYHREEVEMLPEGLESAKAVKTMANDTSEYNSFSMRDTFKDKFLDSIMAVNIRLIVSILLGLLSFSFCLFENFICEKFGISSSISAPAAIDACLLVSLMLISLPEVVRAIKNVLHAHVVPEFTALLVALSVLLYDVLIAVIAPFGSDYPLFSSLYAVMAINSIYATHCLQNANFAAFKTISEKGNKYVLDKPLTRNLEAENIALDGVVPEFKSRTARAFSTIFVSGFFANSKKNTEKSKNNLLIMAISFGVALVSAGVMLFIKGTISPISALSTFVIVVSLSVPAFSILAHKLPYKDAEMEAAEENSAIVGESALIDYSAVDVFAFDDTEVFGPDDVILTSATAKRSEYHDTMKKMASLFAALGGPLSRLFEASINKKCSPAERVVIEDDGASGYVEGKLISAGSAEYMKRNNIRIPTSVSSGFGSTKVFYAASDGEFFAHFTVHYSFSEEFALHLSSMKDEGIIPLVYTRDFNINNDFMRFLTGGSDLIRVLKKYSPVSEKVTYDKLNSVMVASGEKSSLINLILASKRYFKFQTHMATTEITATATGAALGALIALCGMMISIPTSILSLWHIGWSVVLAFVSRKTFIISKKDNSDAEN